MGSAQLNEYISGTIVDLPQQGHLTVMPSASAHPHGQSGAIRINLFENLFGILSDNAPPIRELTEGKHVLCRRHRTDPVTNLKYHFYQSGTIVQRTTDAKFHVMCDDQTEVLCLPRQSIRLFLPPWHDGQCHVIDRLFTRRSSLSCFTEIPLDWNDALDTSDLFKSLNTSDLHLRQGNIELFPRSFYLPCKSSEEEEEEEATRSQYAEENRPRTTLSLQDAVEVVRHAIHLPRPQTVVNHQVLNRIG